MHEHPWAAHGVDGRHPGVVLRAFPGMCWQIQGGDSPSAPVTNWDLYHHMVSRSTGKKEGTFNADVKVDVQGDKEGRYQEQGLLQSGRTCRTESESRTGGWRRI